MFDDFWNGDYATALEVYLYLLLMIISCFNNLCYIHSGHADNLTNYGDNLFKLIADAN